MTAAKLAKAAKVSVYTIHSIETRGHLPNIRTAERILRALNHELEVVHNGEA